MCYALWAKEITGAGTVLKSFDIELPIVTKIAFWGHYIVIGAALFLAVMALRLHKGIKLWIRIVFLLIIPVTFNLLIGGMVIAFFLPIFRLAQQPVP